MRKPAPESLLTKAQAKAKLGNISDGILSRLIRQGKLRAVKYGKTTPLMFRALDVERCLESSLTPAAEEMRSAERGVRNEVATPAADEARKDSTP